MSNSAGLRCGGLHFPDAVRDLRRGIGLSQQEFAEIVGLTRRQIAEIEVGGANPRLETLEKVGRGAWSLASWRSQSRTLVCYPRNTRFEFRPIKSEISSKSK
ncbi:helix-turn-helix domain-containing protein [Ensifer sp. Root423]